MIDIRGRGRTLPIALLFVLLAGSLVGVAFVIAGEPAYLSANSSTPALSCGRGIPAEKCNPELAPPLRPLPLKVTKPKSTAPLGPKDRLCGRYFFISQQLHQMRIHFGSISCFGLGDRWIIVGDGQQTNPATLPPPPTVGGAIIAVEQCEPNDTMCLNSNVPHSFSNFTVSYPPNPAVQLEVADFATLQLINVTDGGCSSFTFDTVTRRWYTTTPSSVAELSSAKDMPSPIKAPPSVTANIALSAPSPHADLGSCFER